MADGNQLPAEERILRMFAWLDDIARYGGGRCMLAHAWARLACLLDAMATAGWQPGPGTAGSRPAVPSRARPPCWSSVTAARLACGCCRLPDHVADGRNRVA